jgi:hypothetical protein
MDTLARLSATIGRQLDRRDFMAKLAASGLLGVLFGLASSTEGKPAYAGPLPRGAPGQASGIGIETCGIYCYTFDCTDGVCCPVLGCDPPSQYYDHVYRCWNQCSYSYTYLCDTACTGFCFSAQC